MSMMTVENADGVLWLAGNVMPSEEKRLNDELRQYIEETSKDAARIVDMSAVKYISSSAAKTLLTIAQEASVCGGKLKVRSSIPVVRTLSLLGAETWCEVESCREPNRRPSQTSGNSPRIVLGAPSTQKSDGTTRLFPADPSAAMRDSNKSLAAVGRGSSGVSPDLDDTEVKETIGGRKSTVGLNAPGTSIVRSSAGQTGVEAALVANAAAKAGMLLVDDDDDDLDGDLAALKKLVVMKAYTFHLMGQKAEITGKVLAHVGGPWIIIENHGTKKMLNIKQVSIIELLS